MSQNGETSVRVVTMSETKITQKIIVVGDAQGGKTSIVNRFTDGQFSDHYQHTIGVDFKFKTAEVGDTTIRQQIWDTAGYERFASIIHPYYQGAAAVVLVLDGTKSIIEQTQAIAKYTAYAKRYAGEKIPIYVAVNKHDLTSQWHEDFNDKSRIKQVFLGQGIDLKDECIFFCSAKTDENIDELFGKIAGDFANLPDLIKHSPIPRNGTTTNPPPPSSKSPSAVALFFINLWKKHKLWLAGNVVILAGAAVFFTLAAFAVGSFLTFGILPSAFIGAGIIVGGALALWNIGYGIYKCYKDYRYQEYVPNFEDSEDSDDSDDSKKEPPLTSPPVVENTKGRAKKGYTEPVLTKLNSVEDTSDTDSDEENNQQKLDA